MWCYILHVSLVNKWKMFFFFGQRHRHRSVVVKPKCPIWPFTTNAKNGNNKSEHDTTTTTITNKQKFLQMPVSGHSHLLKMICINATKLAGVLWTTLKHLDIKFYSMWNEYCIYFFSSVCIRLVFWMISDSRLFTVLLVLTRSQNRLACSVFSCKGSNFDGHFSINNVAIFSD